MTTSIYASLLRNILRQRTLTSDALLMTADALDQSAPADADEAEEVARVSRLMRELAPAYATTPLPPAPAAPPNSDAAIKTMLDVYPCTEEELRDLHTYASARFGRRSEATQLLGRIGYWTDQRQGRAPSPTDAADALMRRYAPGEVVALSQGTPA